MGGISIPRVLVSTFRPDESKVEIETSLRAIAAAVGVASPSTKQRTAFGPNEIASPLEIAIDKHANVDDIPNQNIAKAKSLGLEYFKKMKF